MNKKVSNRDAKIEFIRNILNNNNNIDFIFLIDVNNIDYVLIEGYNKYTDGRNILFIKNNIHNNVIIENNVFNVDNIIKFAYLIPKENKGLKEKIIEFINNKDIIIGDLNVKSNDLYKNIKNSYGESSLQTILINKRPIHYKKIAAPSDHNIIIYDIKLKIKFNTNLRICELDENENKKQIKNILENKEFRFKPKVTLRKYNYYFNDREKLNDEILDEYINNNVRKAYKKYNYLWKNFRKEPFLGTVVNDNIIKTFAKHLKSKEDKIYCNLIIDDDIKFKEGYLKKTKSNALNYDYVKLNTIYNAVYEYIYTNYKERKEGKNKEIINNIIRQINKCKGKLRANTFFLLKNKKLEDFNDVRMIVIMPVLVKLYETIIFDEVNEFLSELILKDDYQYGGVRNGSTYRALFNLRKKMEECNEKIRATLLLDMTKGYDSINLDKLEEMVERIQNKRIKMLLLNWVYMVKNLDLVMNDKIVKKTRGVPMGLTLSPLMFVFYVHNILSSFNKNNIVLYIDDIATFIPQSFNNNQADLFIENLINTLKEYDLEINKKKSVIISNDDHFIKKYKNIFDFKDGEKYLGRELKIGLDGKLTNDDRCYFDGKKLKGMPYWINFAIKRLIYNGALDARMRYKFYMWPTDNINIRKKIWEKSWNMYKSGESKYNYVQMSLVSTNIFRYMIDPMLILKCYNDLIFNNKNEDEMNERIRNALITGKKQLDIVINKLKVNWNIDKIKNIENVDWFDITKEVCENLWKDFKNKMYINYMDDKKEKNIFAFTDLNINSKFIKNFSFINDLVFNHVIKNRNKQKLLWKFLEYIFDKFYKWYKKDDNWQIKEELNFDDFNIREDRFNVVYDDWENIAKKKNIEWWGCLEDLFKLENRTNRNINFDKNWENKINNIFKKIKNKGINSLNKEESYIYNLNPTELYYYKINVILNNKNNEKRLKNAFNKILKLFFIFDSLYGDKYYNNCNFEEIRLNLLIKVDTLDNVADKIVRVINTENVIDSLKGDGVVDEQNFSDLEMP